MKKVVLISTIFISMIRLKDLLESKQVGDIYHFTPLSNVAKILKTQYMIPNDEKQISATRWADMSTAGFQDMKSKPIARFMFDGNKISTKYQIRPFGYEGSGLSGAHLSHDDFEKLGEEQIVVNNRNFYFMPYLKRIDIFVQTGNPDLSKSIAILNQMNIPYSVYQGTPRSNIPYAQSKEGDPTQLTYKPVPKEILISSKALQHPYPNYKTYEFTNNPETYPLSSDTYKSELLNLGFSWKTWDMTPKYPNFYVQFSDSTPSYDEVKSPISKIILDSIIFKSWNDLKIYSVIKKLTSDIVEYYPGFSYVPETGGLRFLPKEIADKYLIAQRAEATDLKKWITPKSDKKTKYDWTGIDTPNDPNM